MDITLLDTSLRRTEAVENFESMIWTERFSDVGDFELIIDPSVAETGLFSAGNRLVIDKSDRVMVIDTTEKTNDVDGVQKLKVTGKSLEDIFNSRPNQSAFSAGAAAAQQTLTGLPADIVRTLFTNICRTNANIPTDNIPFIQSGVYSSTVGAIAEPASSITVLAPLDTLFNTIKTIVDTYHLGFRLIRPAEDSKLYFEVYPGFDRTSSQTALPAVIFSNQLDNLTDTTEFTTTAILKNVAYVFAPNGSRIVYASGVDPAVTGFDKKALIVDASDITLVAGAPLNAALDQRGLQALAQNRTLVAFDGQISQTAYIYGTNYRLGDLVEQRSDSGIITQMRVTEQIFVSDAEGERSYPTLSVDALITPGTWGALAPNKVWNDYTTEVWASV